MKKKTMQVAILDEEGNIVEAAPLKRSVWEKTKMVSELHKRDWGDVKQHLATIPIWITDSDWGERILRGEV